MNRSVSRFINTHGFTLIELLVAVSVLVIIGSAAYLVFDAALNLYQKSESRIVMGQKCRIGLDRIATDLTNMQAIQGDEALALISQDEPGETGDRDLISFVTLINTDPDPFLAQLNLATQVRDEEDAEPLSEASEADAWTGAGRRALYVLRPQRHRNDRQDGRNQREHDQHAEGVLIQKTGVLLYGRHHGDRDQQAQDRPPGVGPPMQTERQPAPAGIHRGGEQGIAGCCTHAFAGALRPANTGHHPPAVREVKPGLGDG